MLKYSFKNNELLLRAKPFQEQVIEIFNQPNTIFKFEADELDLIDEVFIAFDNDNFIIYKDHLYQENKPEEWYYLDEFLEENSIEDLLQLNLPLLEKNFINGYSYIEVENEDDLETYLLILKQENKKHNIDPNDFIYNNIICYNPINKTFEFLEYQVEK